MKTTDLINLVAALGQLLGALFTAAAVIVALYIASRDRRTRTEADRARSAAQARRVIVQYRALSEPRPMGDKIVPWILTVNVKNLSESPILDVVFEGWVTHEFTQKAEFGRFIAGGIITPETDLGAELRFEGTEELPKIDRYGWRVSWTDGDGIRWAAGGSGSDRIPPTGAGFFEGSPRREPSRMAS